MHLRKALIALFTVLGIATSFAAEPAPAPPPSPAAAPAPEPAPETALDFALPISVIDLSTVLVPRTVGGPAVDSNSVWFTVIVRNSTATPSTRILSVADWAGAGLNVWPPTRRLALIEAAGSDSAIAVEPAAGFGANAFRVVVPPAGVTTIALHVSGLRRHPPVLAWTEPALVQHNRQAAILSGTVAGLVGAAMAFALGIAVLSGTLFARWAAVFLASLLVAELTSIGLFDGSFLSTLGGPYGLFAFAVAAALASATQLLECIAPFETPWIERGGLGVLVLGAGAFLGVPVAGLLIRILAIVAAATAAAHLAQSGRDGGAAGRRLAPAATIFALVTAAAGANAIGLFGTNLVATGAIGGFAAAGALLVAIASAVPLDAKPIVREMSMPAPSAPAPAPPLAPSRDLAREHAALSASHQGVFDLDMNTGLVSLSAEAAQLFGLPPGAVEFSPETWINRIHPEDRDVYREALTTYGRDPGIAFRIEFRARASGARMAWFELRATMTGQATEAERCLGLIANVTQRKNAEIAEVTPGPTDPLTGLGTRAALIAQLDSLRDRFKSARLAVFDVDRFKSVNDSLGRDGGDQLLVALAERVTQGFAAQPQSPRVTLFRVGGDMFAALTLVALDLKLLGERLVDMLAEPFTIGERDIFLVTSVGMASGEQAQGAEDLLQQAERALVQAKREGGGRASLYSGKLGEAPRRDSVAIETDLRRALEKNEVELHYQPIVRLKDGATVGFEALMRWRHPERGLIEPDGFVPQAERSALIVRLGKFALDRATEDLARWQQFSPAKPPLFVSVNVAWRQIADKSFVKDLALLLKRTNLPKGSLRLEMTEGQVMAGAGRTEALLKRLKTLGAGLAIDDFGTGHSSLSRLAQYPFDTIKIDKTFVTASAEKNGTKILASIISLAHELKLSIVAEGIETAGESARLKEMGCEFGQGYLMGVPVPASEIDATIAKAGA